METNGEAWLRAIKDFDLRALPRRAFPTPAQRALFLIACAFFCVTLAVTLYTAFSRSGDLGDLYGRLFQPIDRWQYSRYRWFIWSTWLGVLSLQVALFFTHLAKPVAALRAWVLRP